jgi:transcriptional regulator with XRE-family HTH domain
VEAAKSLQLHINLQPPATNTNKKARARSGRDAERRGCRRPIDSDEVPYLVALGCRVRELRARAELTQAKLAELAKLSVSTVGRIEAGARRTRRSTLGRIAAVVAPRADPSLGESEPLADSLAGLGGPALAPESAFADRIARRRERRARKRRGRVAHRPYRAEAITPRRVSAISQSAPPVTVP